MKKAPNAIFMRMKEDAICNSQLKPAYNVQHGVDSEYIVWADVSAHPTDTPVSCFGNRIIFLKTLFSINNL